jgi:hypothetical protein
VHGCIGESGRKPTSNVASSAESSLLTLLGAVVLVSAAVAVADIDAAVAEPDVDSPVDAVVGELSLLLPLAVAIEPSLLPQPPKEPIPNAMPLMSL